MLYYNHHGEPQNPVLTIKAPTVFPISRMLACSMWEPNKHPGRQLCSLPARSKTLSRGPQNLKARMQFTPNPNHEHAMFQRPLRLHSLTKDLYDRGKGRALIMARRCSPKRWRFEGHPTCCIDMLYGDDAVRYELRLYGCLHHYASPKQRGAPNQKTPRMFSGACTCSQHG